MRSDETSRVLRWVVAVAATLLAAGPVWADEPGDRQQAEAAGEELTPPELLFERDAEYTDEAVEAGVEGGVVLELEIDDQGAVVDVEVLDGLGYGLDEAAREAAMDFEFRPARVDGEPIPVVIDFTVHFSLPTIPAQFEGVVVDAESGDPIEGAGVEIRYVGDEHDPAPEASTVTDPDGSFFFGEVPPGRYDVEIRLDEHRDLQTDVDLGEGEKIEVEYSVRARDENVSGQIREAGTRTPLSGMEVVVEDAETGEPVREDFSEAEGRFGFRGVEPGDYLLRVDGSGYSSASFEIEVVEGEATTGSYYVRADDYGDLTVRTTERRERSEVDRQTIDLEETRRMAGAGTDPVRVVENLPGVARQSYFEGQPVVRGAAPEDTEIFLEGDNIPLAFHFLGGPAVVATEMVESVDFYPGNFSSRYGRATGGIIDMQTRSPKDDRFHGTVEADLLDTSAIVEGPIGDNFSFALAGRRSYYDLLLPSVLDRLETDVFVSPRYYDYQGWGTYRSDDGRHKVEAFVYGSDDRLELLLPDDEPAGDANIQTTGADFANYFDRLQLSWEYSSDRMPYESRLMASTGRNSFGIEFTEDLYFDIDYYGTQLRWDNELELTGNLDVRTGIDTQIGPVDYGFAFPEVDTGPDDPQPAIDVVGEDRRRTWQVDPAVYTELDYEMFDRWVATPGLRVDYYGDIGQTSVSPRFASRLRLTDEVTAKGGVGLFTQPPQPGQTEEGFGNPDLTYQKAMHYAVGAEWLPRDFLEVDTTLFYRNSRDRVEQTGAETMEGGQRSPQIYDNAGRGRAYGWELLLRHYPRNNFFGWLSYTLSRSERLDRETGDWELFDADQTHILTFVAGYELPGDWDVSGRFRVVTGNPETPVVGATFDADDDTYRPRYGEPNSRRAGTFHQLDLRVDRHFIFSRWRMSAYLDITNVYNATNPQGTQYNYDYTESSPVRGIPFLPTIGVTARF